MLRTCSTLHFTFLSSVSEYSTAYRQPVDLRGIAFITDLAMQKLLVVKPSTNNTGSRFTK